MNDINIVNLKDDDKVSTALLLIISKLSLTRPEESLQLLAMCAKDDSPKTNVLNYAMEIIERNEYSNLM